MDRVSERRRLLRGLERKAIESGLPLADDLVGARQLTG
jgi:hypothetical protein